MNLLFYVLIGIFYRKDLCQFEAVLQDTGHYLVFKGETSWSETYTRIKEEIDTGKRLLLKDRMNYNRLLFGKEFCKRPVHKARTLFNLDFFSFYFLTDTHIGTIIEKPDIKGFKHCKRLLKFCRLLTDYSNQKIIKKEHYDLCFNIKT